jgi:alanine or glycine:cation symporter, AGCS family
VFNFAGASMRLITTINLIAIVAISGTVVASAATTSPSRAGPEPVLRLSDMPELRGKVDTPIWN